jgi:hypothetical protein
VATDYRDAPASIGPGETRTFPSKRLTEPKRRKKKSTRNCTGCIIQPTENKQHDASDKRSKHITKASNKTGKLNIEASGEYKFQFGKSVSSKSSKLRYDISP